jgi:hypothetical protein
MVRLVKAGRPTGTTGRRWNSRRSYRDEQGQCSNAYPEESHVRVLPLAFAPRTGQRKRTPVVGRCCDRRLNSDGGVRKAPATSRPLFGGEANGIKGL